MEPINPEEPHKRRPRYQGSHPRKFAEKYKELDPLKYQEDIEKVIARGDTPAGTHRSICVQEILEILRPQPGEIAVDATLGYGGHAREILPKLLPGGKLFGLDVDRVEQPKTEARLRKEGFGPDAFTAIHSNFAALPAILESQGISKVDIILADLGVSSMQIDNPNRGFTFKRKGPLDMRMNPEKGRSAAELLATISEKKLALLIKENSDESYCKEIAAAIVSKKGSITTTEQLADTIRKILNQWLIDEDYIIKAIRRTFQAIRIEVNGEFSALETFLAALPYCLNEGGRVVLLTFHSGEDNRVVRSFEKGKAEGLYSQIFETEIRSSAEERYNNPRSKSVRLRFAFKA